MSILDYVFDAHGFITGLSSNYFYYDISEEVLKRSIGVYSVLVEINFCLQNHFPYYYLGLYLPHCRKMNYKANYKPYQLLLNGIWTNSPGWNSARRFCEIIFALKIKNLTLTKLTPPTSLSSPPPA